MHREVQVRFGEERQGNSSTTPCLLLYYRQRSSEVPRNFVFHEVVCKLN